MRLSPPTNSTFFLSLVLVLAALAGQFAGVEVVQPYSFWLLAAGYVVLFLGNLLKGL
jgi:hypothetical protein